MLRNALLSLLATGLWKIPPASAADTKRPNVVFILVDDQDALMNSLDYMPSVQKLLVGQGTYFQKHYCTVAWCCPSRVSIWTGKTAHNTNVTNVRTPYGGYPKFVEEGLNDNWAPVWLQKEGYQTYYTGKLMNAQSIDTYNKPFAKGFTGSDFLLDPNTYSYINPIFQRNQDSPVYYQNNYSTDLVHQKAINFLDDAVTNSDSPFFLAIAPIAPHSDYKFMLNNENQPIGVDISPPVAADRHKELFPDAIVPRTGNFNPEAESGVDWIASLERLSPENLTYNDHLYRQRLRSLQAVDDIVEDVFDKLEEYGILDNTYVFYSSDNGYHIGQHRLAPGKGCGFEEDINVPFVVRGPGIPAGKVIVRATSHTDLAPTWWEILGIPLRDDFDGVPIPLTEQGLSELESSGKAKEHVQIEFWSLDNPQEYNNEADANNTYKGMRIVGGDYGFYYSVWCSNSHELYDMKTDASQMHNLYPGPSASTSTTIPVGPTSYPLSSLLTRLDSLLLVLKTCQGRTCVDPWGTLLPSKNVYTLAQAMDTHYDDYFAGLPRVEFDECTDGHLKEVEGPIWEDGEASVERQVDWAGK